MTAFEGGTWAGGQKQEAPEEPSPVASASSETSTEGVTEDGERVTPVRRQEIPGVSEQDKKALGITGGRVGTGVALSIEAAKKIGPLIPNIIKGVTGQATGQALDPNRPANRMALQNWLNTMLQNQGKNVNLPISKLEEMVGKEIRTMTELGEAYKKIQPTPSERVAKTGSIDPRTGQPRQMFRTIPGEPGIDLTPYEVKPKTGLVGKAIEAGGKELKSGLELVKSLIPSGLRIGFGGLSGVNAAMTGYEAYEMAQKLKEANDPSWVDYARLASKIAATTGGGLSVLPFGVTQFVGAGLQAPETVWSSADAIKKHIEEGTKEDAMRGLTNVDVFGNPLGSVVYESPSGNLP